MWVQPEITQKLYVALWAAFLASCFFPYRLVGLAVGEQARAGVAGWGAGGAGGDGCSQGWGWPGLGEAAGPRGLCSLIAAPWHLGGA